MIYLDLVSTGIFTFLGTRMMIERQRRLFTVMVSGVLTPIGGGTVRDLLVGDGSVFWLGDFRCPVVITTVLVLSCHGRPIFRHPPNFAHALNWFGTSTFIVVGIDSTLEPGISTHLIVTMGVLTGIGGWMIRDHLLTEKEFSPPDIILIGLIYFLASVAFLLISTGVSEVICVLAVFVLFVFAEVSDAPNHIVGRLRPKHR